MGNPAARIGDMHVCPKVEPGPVPHVGGPIEQGSPDVIIGNMPTARVGDKAVCVGPLDEIASGSSTVFINGKPAALMGDFCTHGGKIVSGCPTVIIGNGGGSGGLAAVALTSAPRGSFAKPPTTKAEAMRRMAQATDKVKACRTANQPLPQSPYSTADKLQIVEQGLNEKFIVRVIETQYAGDKGTIGYLPEGATTATYWTTTYTQLEHADKDAELIANTVGVDYDPDKGYTLLLIDQEEANAAGDMVSFIPTYDDISAFAQRELKKLFPGNEHLIEPAMTAEYSQFYEKVVNAAKKKDVDLNKEEKFSALSKSLGFNDHQRRLLRVRHKMAQNLGANEQFLGNGMTKDNNAVNLDTPFGSIKAGYSYGPLETFTYDKNPQTLGKLELAGIVTRIPLNNA